MKEILQTKVFKNLKHLLPVLLLMHTPAFFHVENVAKDSVVVEVEDPEEVYQEEQHQEFEVADPAEEQVPESNFANPDSQQGKHRNI